MSLRVRVRAGLVIRGQWSWELTPLQFLDGSERFDTPRWGLGVGLGVGAGAGVALGVVLGSRRVIVRVREA